MKFYTCILQIKEKGTKNKIKATSTLTEEGMGALIHSHLCEMMDFPRKEFIAALKETKLYE